MCTLKRAAAPMRTWEAHPTLPQPVHGRAEMTNLTVNPAGADPLDRDRIDVVPPITAFPTHDDQPHGLEDRQVLHDRGPAERGMPADQIPRGQRRLREVIENGPPGRIAQRSPDAIFVFHVTQW